ncbi:LysR family transcriptional regulator [Bordetella avium]|uniref:LysR family transcriptional regulator n=1 Tax=Bordetella avium TaxID=521 RepID=UPI000E0A6105|nr:LysR family transcriptional regulator [Bordetella avium]AZY53853.1 LysR family transcriptional regulator [Bordetella avium]RIQ15374.1 LysR family transcriptional regulator [Bordetella avium]RIQ38517.1 LysR family transcriptional regulator [Bordetella avium]RIQ43056.1 LysR family transcriptional regulator [Bordetella avium]RIQ44009.1 LysR family transcriptional regulator [Bordetella avium]
MNVVERQPSLRQLRGFVEVARHASFSRAAQALALSQPALSSAIRELETTLDALLLDRSTHHVRLTSAGQALYVQVQWMLNAYEEGTRELHRLLRSEAAVVRIGCVPSAMQLIAPLLAAWEAAEPGIALDLRDMLNDDILAGLESGALDLGLGLNFGLPPKLQADEVAQDDLVAVVAPDHPLAGRGVLQWKDLAGQHLAVLTRGSTHSMILAALAQYAPDAGQVHALNYTASFYSLVRAGQRVGLISRLYTRPEPAGSLAVLGLGEQPTERRIALLFHAVPQRPAVARCHEWFRQALRPV